MLPRRSLAVPLSLGITMICLLIMVLIGWILVTVFAALKENGHLHLLGAVAAGHVYTLLCPCGRSFSIWLSR